MAKTLYQKIVDSHTVKVIDSNTVLLYCDIHFANEYTSPQAFAGLVERKVDVLSPDSHLCVVDHIIPTHDETPRRIYDEASLIQAQTLESNCKRFGIAAFYGPDNPLQGIEHVVMEEQGLVRPGMVVICGDSHTTTHGAIGALGFGIGTSEIEHILATQTLVYRMAGTMRITINGKLTGEATAKDLVLAVLRKISARGAGTRSQVKDILKAGRVTVDGNPEKDGSRKIDPAVHTVTLDGQPLGGKRRMVVMLNKPAGYVTATEDAAEKTVMELLPEAWRHMDLRPVGRLDKATEGLLLFTNDGELLHRLISPKKEVAKVYYARHEGQANADDISAFAAGLTLRDGTVCLPALLEPLGPGESRITVREGKYHQVRRMMASRNMTVTYLERRQEGTLTLGDLPRGRTRELTEGEIALLEGKTQP